MATELSIETPLILSDPISQLMGRNVYLKMEALQPSGSFKNRGIGHYCSEKAKSGAKEFVCSSGGNAGLAAAYAAKKLQIPITAVVPNSTSVMMMDRIKKQQASVVQKGDDWQGADDYAQEACKSRGACYVPPFDDPLIWSGNATLIHEVEKSGLKPGAVVLSVGGGGLFCGVAKGMDQLGWSDIPIYAVETAGAASLAASMQAGKVIEIDSIQTIAKSLGARAVASKALKLAQCRPTFSKVVSDSEAVTACQHFAEDHRLLVEPACGASLSLCYEGDSDLKKHDNILVVVCGGAAVTPNLLNQWLINRETESMTKAIKKTET